MANELLARASRPGVGDLDLLDLAPIIIVGGHHTALLKQPFEALRAGSPFTASAGYDGGDLVGDFIAVGAVGADGPGRPAPGPADGVQAIGDPPPIVDELAAFEWNIGDGRGRIADRGNDQRRRDRIGFAGAARGDSVLYG